MFKCVYCHSTRSREEHVNEVFHSGDRYVLVEGVPATVCADCGDRSFSPAAAARCQDLIQSGAKSDRSAALEVLDFPQPAPRV